MKRWQIGYRLLSEIEAQGRLGIRHPGYPGDVQDPRFTTPYHDLPEFDAIWVAADFIYKQLASDFPTAEWRLVEQVGKPQGYTGAP